MKLWDYIEQILNRQNLYLSNVFFCKKKKRRRKKERHMSNKKKTNKHTTTILNVFTIASNKNLTRPDFVFMTIYTIILAH